MTFRNCLKDAVDITRVNADLLAPSGSHLHSARGSVILEVLRKHQATFSRQNMRGSALTQPKADFSPQMVRCEKWLAKDWWHTISAVELN